MGDTIAAISTGMGNSGISIIRMCGKNAFDIARKVFRNKKDKKIEDEKTHYILHGNIVDEEEIIDEVLLLIMKAPHTFTGEDTIEIDCHGGIFVTKKILEVLFKNGAQPAEPGEFTKRAFLNGKMDLSRAEAVMDIIQSKSEYALKSSISQLEGVLQKKIEGIREKVLYHTAFIESAIDDPEHVSVDGYAEVLQNSMEELLQEIQILLKKAKEGKVIKEGINVAIIGKPNAGKSSLMNALIGEERAIVTDIAGTTRDILEESILLNGFLLNIVDTAGIRNSDNVVEKIGVERAKKATEKADLILYVVDGSKVLEKEDYEIIEIIKEKKTIVLLNKSDLNIVIEKNELETYFKKNIILISVIENKGIEELERQIEELFFQGEISFNDEVYITNERHKNLLEKTQKSLQKVLQSIKNHMPEDFYSIDLMDAYEYLGTIIGKKVGEDLIDEIFGKFCMGK